MRGRRRRGGVAGSAGQRRGVHRLRAVLRTTFFAALRAGAFFAALRTTFFTAFFAAFFTAFFAGDLRAGAFFAGAFLPGAFFAGDFFGAFIAPAMPAPTPPNGIPAVAEAPAPPAPAPETRLLEVKSPMVGTFYRSPEPGKPPYVTEGQRIEKGQILCIIEAMKIMNEIESEFSGVIRQVTADDAHPVEYGQVLFRIDPNG